MSGLTLAVAWSLFYTREYGGVWVQRYDLNTLKLRANALIPTRVASIVASFHGTMPLASPKNHEIIVDLVIMKLGRPPKGLKI